MIEPTISIIGSGSAEAALAARALLAGNDVADRRLDTDGDPIGRRERAGLGADRPVVGFPDGSQVLAPADFVEPFPGRAAREYPDAEAAEGRSRSGMSGPARTPPEFVDRYVATANWRTELARRSGLRVQPSQLECDAVIVGAGPADLTAAVLACGHAVTSKLNLSRVCARRAASPRPIASVSSASARLPRLFQPAPPASRGCPRSD